MLFPISGIEVNPFIPFVVAYVVSFITSMGGVSGAFLLLPSQVSMLGYTAPSVSATNQVFNIVAIPSGVYRYIREGRMLLPLTWAVIIGTLPGVFIGAWILRSISETDRFLKDSQRIEEILKIDPEILCSQQNRSGAWEKSR